MRYTQRTTTATKHRDQTNKKKKKKPEVLLAITQRIADDKQCKKRTRRQADRQTLSQPEEADKNKDTETGRGPQRKIHEKKIEKIKRNCE